MTAILFASKYQDRVSCVVADSPFSDLEKLILDLAAKHYSFIPGLIVGWLIDAIESEAQRLVSEEYGDTAQFRVRSLKPVLAIKGIQVPIFFIAGKNDELVQTSHANDLYDAADVYK